MLFEINWSKYSPILNYLHCFLKVKSDLLSPAYHQYGAMSQFSEESFNHHRDIFNQYPPHRHPKVYVYARQQILLLEVIATTIIITIITILMFIMPGNTSATNSAFSNCSKRTEDGPSSYSYY